MSRDFETVQRVFAQSLDCQLMLRDELDSSGWRHLNPAEICSLYDILVDSRDFEAAILRAKFFGSEPE